MLKKLVKNKIPDKITALMLIITLTFVNIMLLGSYFLPRLRAFAAGDKVETGHNNVVFDAYFTKDSGKTREIVEQLTNQRTLSLYVNVKDGGYLKDAYISLRDENNTKDTNFNLLSGYAENDIIQSVDVTNKVVKLRQVGNGTSVPIEIPIALEGAQDFNLDNFKKDTYAKLTGTYVYGEEEYPISGTVKLNIKWEGTLQAVVDQTIESYIKTEDYVIIQYLVKTSVKDRNTGSGEIRSLPIKTTNISMNLPEFEIGTGKNTFEPESVKVSARSTYITNGERNVLNFSEGKEWTYDITGKVVNIKTENLPDEDNFVNCSYGMEGDFDEYVVTYKYPASVAEAIGDNTIKATSVANLKLVGYNGIEEDEVYEASDVDTLPVNLKDPFGNTILFIVDSPTKKIQKGYMYNNFDTTEKHETE